MNDALKKLRFKFVAIIMTVVAVILAVVFVVVVATNHTADTDEVYRALESAIMRADSPDQQPPQVANPLNTGDPSAVEEENESFSKDATAKTDALGESSEDDRGLENETGNETSVGDKPGDLSRQKEGARFEIGGPGSAESLIPVAVYSIATDGSLELMADAASGAIADTNLSQVAARAVSLQDGHGFDDALGVYYLKERHGGKTFIAFADERSAAAWQTQALELAAIWAAALLLFFFISLAFSQWALRPVRRSWEQQQRFIADASHELKTPLTVMAADTAILKRNTDQSIASQSQWIESIETEIDSMQHLVGDMLLLARADANEEHGRETHSGEGEEIVDLSRLVETDLLQFEPVAYERTITLASEVEPGLHVKGEPEKLKRLIDVLFDNAFKFVDPDGTIKVALQRKAIPAQNKSASASLAQLTVTNTGAPIPAADLPHIFERFYRSDKARTRAQAQSFGLGLSIAYEVADQHGGNISAESTAETGTTFTVTLPLA